MATGTRWQLAIDAAARAQLLQWSRRRGAAHALVQRARIVLDAAAGLPCIDIAARHGVTPQTVSKWCRRYAESGLDGLRDAPRGGGPKQIDRAAVERVMLSVLREPPPNGMHWTTRGLARHLGMSQSAISRIWRRHGILPRRQGGLMPSADALLNGRVSEMAGLYIAGGTRVLALSAMSGSVPGFAAGKTAPANGQGTVIDQVEALVAAADRIGVHPAGKSRQAGARPLLAFLRGLDSRAAPEREIHLLLAASGVERKHSVALWLMRHPRFRVRVLSSPAAWRTELRHWPLLLAERQEKPVATDLRRLLHALHRHIASAVAQEAFSWIKPSAVQRLRDPLM